MIYQQKALLIFSGKIRNNYFTSFSQENLAISLIMRYSLNMKIRKFVSVTIAFFMILPFFAKTVDAETVVSLCVNSGIFGYYSSISNSAFNMAHKVLQEVGMSMEQTSKKEVPAKKETTNKNDIQAVILDSASKKLFKTVLVFIPVFHYTASTFSQSAVSVNTDAVFAGWMSLFILMCILAVRKKDNDEVSLNYIADRRPIVS